MANQTKQEQKQEEKRIEAIRFEWKWKDEKKDAIVNADDAENNGSAVIDKSRPFRSGHLIKIKMNEDAREVIRKHLRTNELCLSESWRDENGKFLDFYKGGLNLVALYNELGLSLDNSMTDNFGSEPKKNLGILRSKELLDNGEVTLFIDMRNFRFYEKDCVELHEMFHKLCEAIMRQTVLSYGESVFYIVEKKDIKFVTKTKERKIEVC